jgi:D-2-hydroxyacid dehydrogenase (NADP+)
MKKNREILFNSILSKKEAKVACDLFLPLKFYHLPGWLRDGLNFAFPNVEIIPVNTPNTPKYIEDASIYWGNRITPEIIDNMINLKWVHFGSVGVNRVNLESIISRKILITSSKGLVISSMVASALAFITSLARGLHYNQDLRRRGMMTRESFDNYYYQIHELSEERCLLVGFGDVGKKLASVLKALDMKISAISKSVYKHNDIDNFYQLSDLSDAVSDADYVVSLLPLNSETNKVFGRDIFSKMKSSAFFINIGRGEVVDEDSLIDALKNNIISGAGLDVFEDEPLRLDSPLMEMKNVILSPHVAGLSDQYWDRQATLFVNNLQCFLNNKQNLMDNITKINL